MFYNRRAKRKLDIQLSICNYLQQLLTHYTLLTVLYCCSYCMAEHGGDTQHKETHFLCNLQRHSEEG